MTRPKDRIVVSKHPVDENSLVLLADYVYWADNYDALQKWCVEYNCDVQGMVVSVPDDETMMLFKIAWC